MNRLTLALALLATPTFAGTSEVPKTPACSEVKAVIFVQKPLLINIWAAKALMREYHAENPVCKMAGRIYFNGGCWKPERIKLMNKEQ